MSSNGSSEKLPFCCNLDWLGARGILVVVARGVHDLVLDFVVSFRYYSGSVSVRTHFSTPFPFFLFLLLFLFFFCFPFSLNFFFPALNFHPSIVFFPFVFPISLYLLEEVSEEFNSEIYSSFVLFNYPFWDPYGTVEDRRFLSICCTS